jgi:antitoxin MazE
MGKPLGRPSPVLASHLHTSANSSLAKSLKIVYLLCIYSERGVFMKTRIQKWGNSLALRIPKSFALETGLDQDALVDVALVDGKLIVTPLQRSFFSLEQLLADITDENRHTEYDTGEAIGNEVW